MTFVATPLRAALLLTVAVGLAYANSLRGVFVFDDLYAIVENPTIRELARLDRELFLPGAEAGTVGGRPVANLTLALNHAVSGTAPWSYHIFNGLVHLGATLALWDVLRRTLVRPALPFRLRENAGELATAIALLWALHPLQTESVTYVIQRVESLMGFFFLLTLALSIRILDSPPAVGWRWAAAGACLLGMGTKEVMAAAPLVVLLYDRTFVSGSWREAWRRHASLHGSLMSTWLFLVLLVMGAEGRGGSAGFATAVSPWHYALTQAGAIPHYLRLVFWPFPLVFDHGTAVVSSVSEIWPRSLALGGLLAGTVWALVRRPALGFPAACFFAILAPSSSIVPVATQTIAEHRMYLPVAAVLTLAVLALHAALGRRALVAVAVVAVALGGFTVERNRDYHSEIALWQHTALHRPANPRAHINLGVALFEAGRPAEAVAHYERALALQPGVVATHLNLSSALLALGRTAEAIAHGEKATALDSASVNARVNLAQALSAAGQLPAAAEHFRAALARQVQAADARAGLGDVLYRLGNAALAQRDLAAAIGYLQEAVELAPDTIPARNNLANALLVTGRADEAIVHYREILRRQPGNRGVEENLAQALALRGAPPR
jgi:protein O-mannosyl-transferase